MNWLRDTWREVTTGGKAKTETYNREPAAPRPASSGSRSSRGGAIPAAPAAPAAPPKQTGMRPGSGWAPSTAATTQRRSAPNERAVAPVTRARAVTPLQTTKNSFGQPGTLRASSGLDPSEAARNFAEEQKLRTPPEEKMSQLRKEAKAAEAQPVNREWQDATTRELSTDEYLALSPRQKAAVQFNTGLTTASATDRKTGGDAATRAFLSELSLLDDSTDVDAFLKLDRAIGEAVLSKLEDKTTRQQSAESLRLSQGIPSGAPNARRFSDSMNAAGTAADAMALKLANGVDTLRPGTAQAAGFSGNLRDTVLTTAYEMMVDSAYNETPDQIAEGLAMLNATNGTDISPQELWDFTKRQVDAVDFGAVRGKAGATVPVTNTTITPLSVQDIRARYGL